MIFLDLCSCVFCHFGILNSFFFVCFCVFKFEFVFGSGFVFVFFVFFLFLEDGGDQWMFELEINGFVGSNFWVCRSWTALDPQKWDVEVKGQNRGIKLGLCWYGWARFVVEQSIIILQYAGLVFGSGFVVELGLCWAIKFSYNILLWFFCVWFLGLYDFFGFVLLCVLPFWDFEFLFFVCFCVICVFKFEFVFGSGFVFVFFVFFLFLILFLIFLFS